MSHMLGVFGPIYWGLMTQVKASATMMDGLRPMLTLWVNDPGDRLWPIVILYIYLDYIVGLE